ncbi:hypothetical protein SAY86_024485 [Trapa natans]|uniref:Uncharacterized protein n=1 Tax=Trapa natans TaxID=22666 RepID=A0AAN7MPH1_TRANT|nr:hypothetical protein SAY86_024485 [Trapa natans]
MYQEATPPHVQVSGYPNPLPGQLAAAGPYISPRGSRHIRTGAWSTNLCHCCDDPANCLITCCCPCVTFGQIAEIVDRGSSSNEDCSGCASRGATYGLLLLTGFSCLYSCFYRSKLRGQYDLVEAPCADCLVHFFCETCALCQEYRELKSRGYDMGIGWEANMDRQKRGVAMTPPMMAHSMSR